MVMKTKSTRRLSEEEVREVRRWWIIREKVYFDYINTPNPDEMGRALGVSGTCVRLIGMGLSYKEVK